MHFTHFTKKTATALAAVAMLLSATAAQAGDVTGRLLAADSIRTPAPLDVTIDAWTCGKDGKIADPRLLIGDERGLADVVVQLRGEGGDPAWPAAEEMVAVDQKGCEFIPHVTVVGPGEKLSLGNSDPTLHNFHTKPKVNKTMNRAQPRGFSFETSFAKPEIQRVECDVHYWMSAVVVVTDTAWTAVTDNTGRFSIAGVEPGTYAVSLWHEELGERSGSVDVTADGATFDLTWTAEGEGEAAITGVAPIAVASCGCRGADGSGQEGEAGEVGSPGACGSGGGCGGQGAGACGGGPGKGRAQSAQDSKGAHGSCGGAAAAPGTVAPKPGAASTDKPAAAPAPGGCGCGKR
ncbi:MAG: plastocyanin [Hyphomicrobiaceae bacterium]|jgi:plastocyanin